MGLVSFHLENIVYQKEGNKEPVRKESLFIKDAKNLTTLFQQDNIKIHILDTTPKLIIKIESDKFPTALLELTEEIATTISSSFSNDEEYIIYINRVYYVEDFSGHVVVDIKSTTTNKANSITIPLVKDGLLWYESYL